VGNVEVHHGAQGLHVDADTDVSSNFLSVMDARLARGAPNDIELRSGHEYRRPDQPLEPFAAAQGIREPIPIRIARNEYFRKGDDARSVMRRLANSSIQSCHLGVPSDDQMVVVARIEAPADVGFSVRIGYRRPILESTSGTVIFAFQPESLRDAWLGQLTAHTSQSRIDAFLKHADEVRAQGYARTVSNFVKGVIDVSAPVEGAYRVVAALTVPFVHRIPPPCTLEETITLVRESAAEISAELQADD